MEITLTQLEEAINYWRNRRPAVGEQCALSPEVNVLAKLYATMIFERASIIPRQQLDAEVLRLLDEWRNRNNKPAL